jgi:hypothetical protein
MVILDYTVRVLATIADLWMALCLAEVYFDKFDRAKDSMHLALVVCLVVLLAIWRVF